MTDETPRRAGRSGGRAARTAARSAPLSEALRPIRPGMQGGTYNPLSQLDMEKLMKRPSPLLKKLASPTLLNRALISWWVRGQFMAMMAACAIRAL